MTRMLALSPMRWTQTLAPLTEPQRAALVPPWEAERRVEGVARAVKVSAA